MYPATTIAMMEITGACSIHIAMIAKTINRRLTNITCKRVIGSLIIFEKTTLFAFNHFQKLDVRCVVRCNCNAAIVIYLTFLKS